MLEKIKKHKYIICIIFISIIYFILTSVQNPVFYYLAGYDDLYILASSMFILDFDWLGLFNGATLTKGPGAPIFIALSNIVRINTYTSSVFTISRWSNFICACFKKSYKK